jgi:hypothetical protein
MGRVVRGLGASARTERETVARPGIRLGRRGAFAHGAATFALQTVGLAILGSSFVQRT